MKKDISQKTIEDFGTQWNTFKSNSGYYGSLDLLKDFIHPLLKIDDFKNKNIADIGSGTGRIVNMLLDAGASHVTAIEPSSCFSVLKDNTKQRTNQITYLNQTGEHIPQNNFDFVTSLGVIHHIKDPTPVILSVYNSLKSGGRFLFWVYGKEGNSLYLSFFKPLRYITKLIPDNLLILFCYILLPFLYIYTLFCFMFPLPMHQYMKKIIWKLSFKKKLLVIFDQLNPTYAKYYSKKELEFLLTNYKWKNIQYYNRHGYSWTVLAEK